MKDELVEHIFATIFSLNNKIMTYSNALSDRITLRQFMFILSVEHIPADECTLNRIASKLETSKQNVRQIADSLLAKKLIEVMPHPTDRRAICFRTTELGMSTAIDFAVKSRGFVHRAGESMTEEELSQLFSLLTKLYEFDGKKRDGYDEHDTPEAAQVDTLAETSDEISAQDTSPEVQNERE